MRTKFFNPVKIFFILLFFTVVLVGCKSSYDITLSNGRKVTGVSKPVFDERLGLYRFKMADGKEARLSSSRVRLIEPHGESSETQFVSPTQKK